MNDNTLSNNLKKSILNSDQKLFQEYISNEKDDAKIKSLILEFFENRTTNKSDWVSCHEFISKLPNYNAGEQDFNIVKTVSDIAFLKITKKEITNAVFLINNLMADNREMAIRNTCVEFMEKEENYSSFIIHNFISSACTIVKDKEGLLTGIFYDLSRNYITRTHDQNIKIQERTFDLMQKIYISTDINSNERVNEIIDKIERVAHFIEFIKNHNLRNYFMDHKNKKGDQKVISQALNLFAKTDEKTMYVDGMAIIYHFAKDSKKSLTPILKSMFSQFKDEHISSVFVRSNKIYDEYAIKIPSLIVMEMSIQIAYQHCLTRSYDKNLFVFLRFFCFQIPMAYSEKLDVGAYIEILYATKPLVNDGLFQVFYNALQHSIIGIAESSKNGQKEVERWLGKNPKNCPKEFHDDLMKEYNEKIKPKFK